MKYLFLTCLLVGLFAPSNFLIGQIDSSKVLRKVPEAATETRTIQPKKGDVIRNKSSEGQSGSVGTGRGDYSDRNTGRAINRADFNVMPLPTQLIPTPEQFIIAADVVVVCDTKNAATKKVAETLGRHFFAVQGFKMKVIDLNDGLRPKKRSIVFESLQAQRQGPEGYILSVTNDNIVVRASTPAGQFYALQTLLQLLPAEAFNRRKIEQSVVWAVPGCTIEDQPSFSYRGLHLDVSRHFFTVQDVKQYIDLMSIHKFNTFHWHLTDDQGWRIEILKYPKLTSVGSIRKQTLIGKPGATGGDTFDGKPESGFYTQAEIKDIVQYATDRFITIVPEIDVPGHCGAVIAAYPELSCDKKPMEVWTTWGVSDGVLCPNEATMVFLKDVFTEVMALFPSPYIHIGGDEVPEGPWKNSAVAQELMRKNGKPNDVRALQSQFNAQLAEFIQSKGRRIIGWDEILEGGAPEDALIMSWRGTEKGEKAVKLGHEVIMTPSSHCYFDHYQGPPSSDPLAIGGYTPIEKVYAYTPIPENLLPAEQKLILGAQANLWTEYITDFNHLMYMTYPRAVAMSEALWTGNRVKRDYGQFKRRMVTHATRLGYMNINYSKHVFDPTFRVEPSNLNSPARLISVNSALRGTLRFSTDGPVTANDQPLKLAFPLDKNVLNFEAAYFDARGQRQSEVVKIKVEPHLLLGRIPKVVPQPEAQKSDLSLLTNGQSNLAEGRHLGYTSWSDSLVQLTFDFGATLNYSKRLEIAFLERVSANFALPEQILIETAKDGINFTRVVASTTQNGARTVLTFSEAKKERYLRISMLAPKLKDALPTEAKQFSTLMIDEIYLY